MNVRPPPPPETVRVQAGAADPAVSAWVSANAGSGKTHVLAQRVVRLLLQGTDPSRILCLTYTRAAAANMSDRVFRTLAAWAMMPDAELAATLASLDGEAPQAGRLARARRLFAQALETPGGLKIQTIHAFCEAVLHQFPLEANIAGHFELLDRQMEKALLAEARRGLITAASGAGKPALTDAFAHVLSLGGETGLDRLLAAIVENREALALFIAEIGDGADHTPLFEAFGFAPHETAETVAAAAWPLPGLPETEIAALARIARETDARVLLDHILPGLEGAVQAGTAGERLEALICGLLTKKREAYAASKFKKSLRDRLPGIFERYSAAVVQLLVVADRHALFRTLEATSAAMLLADEMICRYQALKSARGFLDFADLISRTVALLSRPDAGPWVHYKLDRGIDHLLVDEAQDTSPGQWALIRRLTDEFFAGIGGRGETVRTVFAVGDEKQSIYSFQGAEPAAFAETGRHFRRAALDAEASFAPLQLTWSFRSVPDILEAVDRVFSHDGHRKGVVAEEGAIRHRPIRAGEAGHVEFWEPISPTEAEIPDDWRQPIDHASAPAVRLAEMIADRVREWITTGEPLAAGRRPLPGDIMVLVRKRDRFVHALSRALKERGIDVAGADRLQLTDHIAVQDLIALARFVLQPQDDLSLAALLRGPAFALPEETLFEIAHPRGDGESLFAALRRLAPARPALAAMVSRLDRLAGAARTLRPYEFFAGFLAGSPDAEPARPRFVARLGPEAAEILDEFLNYCLAAERSGIHGLEALLAGLEKDAPEIRREMDQNRDEVRIMTVHAAKGLEAPVVVLVDPGSEAFSHGHLPTLVPFAFAGAGGKGFLWRAGKALANKTVRELEAAMTDRGTEEYRRLLYVGMTRAEDRLLICGYRGSRGPQSDTWADMVRRALGEAPETRQLAVPESAPPAFRFQVSKPSMSPVAPPHAGETAAPGFPEALRRPPPPADFMPRPLSPSRAAVLIDGGDADARTLSARPLGAAAGDGTAMRRGTLVHRLLQALPAVPPADRRGAAHRYVDRAAADWPAPLRDDMVGLAMAVLEDSRFRAAFAPGSRAEISIAGKLTIAGRERPVAGKIDRLAVGDRTVLLVDYKTGLPAPRNPAEVPESHLAQMALYRALLLPLYPDHAVVAALLYAEVPRLVPLPDEMLEAVLARLAAA